MLEIKCKTLNYLPLKRLLPFQGKAKNLSDASYQRLKKQIIETGFAFPFFVWQMDKEHNYLLDGHQRDTVLTRMAEEGEELPEEFPVVFVDASNKKEAKRRLLQANAEYGKFDELGLLDFLDDDFSLQELADFELPGMDNNKLKMLNEEINFEDEGETKSNGDEGKLIQCPKCGFKWQK